MTVVTHKIENRTISVVVPVYNGAQSLLLLHERLTRVLKQQACHYEIIFVEDCGQDSSWDVIQQIEAADSNVRGFRLNRNYGQHNALLCGIRQARSDLIVTIDDDLQNPPEEIPKLIEKMDEGYDVVYGTPQEEQHGFARKLASQITKLVLQGAMGAETARMVSAFRLFRAHLRDAFANYSGTFVSIDVLLTWGSTKIAAIPVKHDKRAVGASNYNLRKLLMHAMNMMTGFSVLPLQVASFVGFFFTLFGICIFAYVVIRFVIAGTPVPGFPFIASIIAIFSGAQLFTLGIMGEYLARMHFRIMNKPPYTIAPLPRVEKS